MVLSADPNRRGSATMTHAAPVLDVLGLSVDLQRPEGPLRLVSDISLTLSASETSASSARPARVRASPRCRSSACFPNAPHRRRKRAIQGSRTDVVVEQELREVRGKEVGVVFQDPQTSLDPSFTIESQMVETIRAHLGLNKRDARPKSDFASRSCRYTKRHAASATIPINCGGMAQRA